MHHALTGADPIGRDPPPRRVLARATARSWRPRACAPAACEGRRSRRRRRSRRCRATSRRRPGGRSAGGPTRIASAPTSLSACTSERATREWTTSPTIATCRPSRRPNASRMREEVEECLCRVLVLSVTRVHDACLGDARDVLRRADLRVSEHDHVRVVGRQRQRRVLQRLALVDRRTGGLQRQRVGRQSLRRKLERRARARRRLVEDVQDQPAAQGRQLLVVAFLREGERPGRREQALDVVAASGRRSRAGGDVRREAAAGRRRRRAAQSRSAPSSRWVTSRTRSISSTSTSSTWTRSPRVVGRFLPT